MDNVEYSWMQISDLHIFENTDWDIMQNAYKKLRDKGKIDFIIVTGDLHQFGDNYKKTHNFLENIVEYFNLTKRDVFIVPGNHDVEECPDKEIYIVYIDSKIKEDQDCYRRCFVKGKLVDCFKQYNNFIKDFYGDIWKEMYPHPEQVTSLEWRGKINIIHLNSAIICDGDNERKQIIDIHKLSDLYNTLNKNLPSIIITHHSFDCIHKLHQDSIKRFLTDLPVSAYLCGDLHKANWFPIKTYKDYNSSIPCIVCGKTGSDYKDVYSDLGCIIYNKLKNSSEVQVVPYEWNNSQKRFNYSSKLNMDDGELKFNLLKKEKLEDCNVEDERVKSVESIWLPDAEIAQGKQTRFGTFTSTDLIEKFISANSTIWGLSAVKGIGKTFVLQIKRTKTSKKKLCLPVGVIPSANTNWATDTIVLGNNVDLASLKNYGNIVSMWKYCILVYVVNQIININKNVTKKWWGRANPAEELTKKVKEYYDRESLSDITYEFCTEDIYMNLDSIVKNIIEVKDWIDIVEKDLNKLLLLRRKMLDFLEEIHKSSIVMFIDKVDQALKQTAAEPPVDCLLCEKKDQVSKCNNPQKSPEYCADNQTSCNVNCCYGCENFATSYSNYNLRIHEKAVKKYAHINLWQYLQLGLVDAVSQIKTEFLGTIEIYFTIRQEAFSCEEWLLGEHRKKVTDITEELWYSKQQQKKIFYDCIRNQEDSLLFNPNLKNNMERIEEAFVGIDFLCHPYARHLKETVFESIYRHSFDRTRDVQKYGEILTENMDQIRNCTSSLERGEVVKDLIEKIAADLAFSSDAAKTSANGCYYYEKMKLLPNYWATPENFKNLLMLIEKNLLFYEELVRICRTVNKKEMCSGFCSKEICEYHPFSMLYKLGMLGHMRLNHNNDEKVVQNFLHSKDITYLRGDDLLNINKYSIYIIHPALTKSIEKLKDQHIKHFQGFILGKDCKVSKKIFEQLMHDHDTMKLEEFEKKYYYQIPN